jgi:hypothetical protein
MSSNRSTLVMLGVTCLLASHARPAAAQFYVGGYLGGNHTVTADVAVTQPGTNTALRFADVTFAARPLQSPQYYGVRIGSTLGGARRYGVEVEFIHLKVIGQTSQLVAVSGTLDGNPVNTPMRMDSVVERYSMTHGLNFLVINAVTRRPIGGGPFAFVGRAGAGPMFPHAETTVRHERQEQYEYAGVGVHAAAGLDVKLKGFLSAVVEYKFTFGSPTITMAAGQGQMRAATHHVAAGLAFGLSR